MKNKKVIVILGGMGPEASGYLYNSLIELSVKYFGAKNNDDFPEILLDSIPVPDFISDDSGKKEALKILKNRVKFLSVLSPSCLAIACNTAHIFIDDLQKISEAPFISMIEEVVGAVAKANLKRVGILGTPMTINSKLYKRVLLKFNIECIEPKNDELKILEKVIRKIIAGSSNSNDKKMLLSVANNLRKRGAQGIILGCTELPLIFPTKQDSPIFNSLEILSMALLQKYYKQNTI